MAKVFLDEKENYSVSNGSEVFGNVGSETLRIAESSTNNRVHSTIERIEFTGTLDSYTFGITGNLVSVKSGSTTVATITVPDTAAGQTLAFADGSAALKITGLNQATLGGIAVPTTPAPIVAPVDPADPSGDLTAGNLFTLTESVLPGVTGTPAVMGVYWGYNPHNEHITDENGVEIPTTGVPADGGIPVADLVDFLTTITGLDFKQLGLIDANGVDPFQNVTSLSLSNPNTVSNAVNGEENVAKNELTIKYADGSFLNAEVALGGYYFNFLNNLLFDANGNTRLYMDVVTPEGSGTEDMLQPIVLTRTVNNGGTLENGLTTAGDDTIVAGRVELLHQAYIDAGAGYNILEIDAKGVYAQPLQLLNIQEVRVNDLPNFYTTADYLSEEYLTTRDTYLQNSTYPLLSTDGSIDDDTWIDLNRATSIERLVVTDQGNGSGVDNFDYSGDLTIVGVRNAATLRLEGGFRSGSTTIQYGQGQTGSLNVELALGDVTEDINILQNAAVLKIDSQGEVNHMHSFFAGGSVSRMYVKGTGEFSIDENIAPSFNQNSAVLIDASANTGGLNINFDASSADVNAGENISGRYASVTVKGTAVNDEIFVTNVDTYTPSQTASNNGALSNGGKVTIDAGNGDNTVVTDGSSIVKITTGIGDDTIRSANSDLVNITAGNGNNVINVDGTTLVTISGGTGDDNISAQNGTTVNISVSDGTNIVNTNGSETVNVTTGTGNDTFTSVGSVAVTIDAGAGNNTAKVSAEEITITTGAGNDKIVIAGLAGAGSETGGTASVNLMLVLDDSGSMYGQKMTDQIAAANSLLNSLPADTAVRLIVYTDESSTDIQPADAWISVTDALISINSLTADGVMEDNSVVLADIMAAYSVGQGTIFHASGNNALIFISDGANTPADDVTLQASYEAFLVQNSIIANAIGIAPDTTPGSEDMAVLNEIAFDGKANVELPAIVSPTSQELTDLVNGLVETIVTTSGNEALVTLDLGAGTNTITLGDSADLGQGLVALDGSTITGSNISIFVENTSDISRATTVEGVTHVTLKGELTATAEQVHDIGAAAFKVYRASFGETQELHIVVNSDTTLGELIDSAQLSTNVRLTFEMHNGATLSLTAAELHQHVAEGGLVGADGLNGKVIITGAGPNFDPFDNGDAYLVIDGGEIGAGDLYGAEDVTIIRDGTYERPFPGGLTDTMTIGSATATAPLIIGTAIVTEAQTLKIIGSQNVEFKAVVDLGGEKSESGKDDLTGQTINGVVQNIADPQTVETDGFTVDFSALTGSIKGLTLDHAQDIKSIKGNGAAGSRIDLILNADLGTAGVNKGLNTTGVETYVVTKIDTNQDGVPDGLVATVEAPSKIIVNLCDLTQGVKNIGLKGNSGSTLQIDGVPWGQVHPAILLEGDGYANWDSVGNLKVDNSPNTSDIGNVEVNYFTSGAPAVVNINNGGVELGVTTSGGERKFAVGTVTLNNASSATFNVSEGDATIADIQGSSLRTLKFVATEDVTLSTKLLPALTSINAAGVEGSFNATLGDPGSHKVAFTGGPGAANLTLDNVMIAHADGATSDFGSSFVGGTGGINLIIKADTSTVQSESDLAFATLTNINKVTLGNGSVLTLSLDQVDAIGVADISVDKAYNTATLNLVGLADKPFSLADFNDGITIGSVTLANVPTVTLDPTTDLTGIGALEIPEGTVLNMSAAQYNQLSGKLVDLNAIPTPDDTTDDTIVKIYGEGTINITGLTQVDADKLVDHNTDGDTTDPGEQFDLSLIFSNTGSLTLAESVDLSEVTMVNGSGPVFENIVMGQDMTLTLGNIEDADGVTIGGSTGNILQFNDTESLTTDSIDASGFNVGTMRILNVLVADRNVDFIFFGLQETVVKEIFNGLGWVTMVDQFVEVTAGTTVNGSITFNKPEGGEILVPTVPGVEIENFSLTLNGGNEINGNLSLSTTGKEEQLRSYLKTVTINSEGTAANLISGVTHNVIKGDITALGSAPVPGDVYNNIENNLLNVTINATQAFELKDGASDGGDIVFSSVDSDVYPDAHLTITGTANVTVENLDVSDDDISTLHIANTGTGTFTVTGASPAIFDDNTDANFTVLDNGGLNDAANLEELIFSGTGAIKLGTATGATGINASELSVLDASALSGELDLKSIAAVDATDFTLTAGTGKTTVSLTDGELDVNKVETPDDHIDGADENGWTFDFSKAAAGSTFEVSYEVDFDNIADGNPTHLAASKLNINIAANTTMTITGDTTSANARNLVDLTDLDLTVVQANANAIVLGAGVALRLTAAQANGLKIIADPSIITDPLDADYEEFDVPVVNIIDLGTAAYDFSGISSVISGTTTLATDDVTLAAATVLGSFSVTLADLGGVNTTLEGQTIRFQNETQAGREIIVTDTAGASSSTNVVWLFDSITAATGVETKDYDPLLGRVWFDDNLVTNEGGLVEGLFTTLPDSILRIEFADVSDILLDSNAVDRVVEVVNFKNVGNMTFSDTGASPEEHINTLKIQMGGQATIGNILVNDVIGAPGITDPSTISFSGLTIESYRAMRGDDTNNPDTNHFLATELYVNNNNGIGEVGESALPNNINTVGNIGLGTPTGVGINLTSVTLDTKAVTTEGVDPVADGSFLGEGANLQVGSITYGYAPTTAAPTTSVLLDVNGANDINITSVITADADIATLNVVSTGFTGVLTAPGNTPAFQLNGTEKLTFANSAALGGTAYDDGVGLVADGHDEGSITLGSATHAGIGSDTLSEIDASYFGDTLALGVVSQIDSTNDDSTPLTAANDGLKDAFNFLSGTGVNTMTLAASETLVPTLAAGSEWQFDFTTAAAGSKLTLADTAVLTTGGTLRLIGTQLYIQGAVNLAPFGVDVAATTTFTEGLIFSGASGIHVPAGQTLTISPAQLHQLDMVNITGSGTVIVVGSANNIDDLGTHIKTMNVDFTGVTLTTDPLVTGFDTNSVVPLTLTGATDDAGDPAGQTVLGSPTSVGGTPAYDVITTGALNDTITGKAGNDIITGAAGSNTFNVDSGTDYIMDLSSAHTLPVPAGTDHDDVLTVSSGATALAYVASGNFVATSATNNNGATNANALLYGGVTDDTTIDMSLAGAGKGFTLLGGFAYDAIPNTVAADTPASATLGHDILIGSTFADIINGGNSVQSDHLAMDTLTGNGGADNFEFNQTMNNAATLTPLITTAGVDREVITVVAQSADGNNETLTVSYTINGAPDAVAITLAAVTSTDANALATAIAAAVDGKAGISAVSDTNLVVISGDNAGSLAITGLVFGGAANGFQTSTAANGAGTHADVAQIETLTISGTPTAGDVYSVIASHVAGGGIPTSYTALAGSSSAIVAAGLEAAFADGVITAGVAGSVITFTDTAANDGGFSLVLDTTAAFAGSGASDTGALLLTTADLITDFVSGTDKIDLNLAAGTATNLVKAAQVASFAAARAAAVTAMTGTDLMYFLTSIPDHTDTAATDPTGLLFFDANLDGTVDGVIALTGISTTSFAYTDIIA